ncbi:phosphatase PAP2 family protein [Xanthobacter tagetidis]|uniref:Phosphatase PAP2 family protein n=1 Tax=Xanthobacter tagetidis TaxID=60216 RepID=A0A3L7AAE4_9HYPH|nr:phosphatase PAP2 family protein [Xanthobacter tagetidis]MBB6309316.1 membrane-associated PAP2 superfamily phosphatase [Xanthobacter tagetidis]RLP76631.1 phosphatase PAP2 family protein [Xanthobacter tagetidis]
MRPVLFLALVIGAAVAILFTVFPQWDLAISGYFWDVGRRAFTLAGASWAKTARSLANWIPWLIAGPAFAAIILKLLFPWGRMFMSARAAVFLAATMALGPGLVVNGILKEEWGRPRPVHVEEFGGKDAYRPWFATDGACPGNCSFVSGEGALGFWLTAPASLVPGPLGVVAMTAAVAFAATAGGLRIAFGGHFFTDVVFSGVVVVLIVVAMRYLIYGRKGAPTDFRMEHAIGRVGYALHALVRGTARALAGLVRRGAAALRALAARHLPGRRAGL